jgi:Holliday junction resolvase RusA-like endonuclease
MISFTVPGRPIPKARPRVVNGHAYTPRETQEYERAVQWHYRMTARSHLPLTVPCAVEMVFRFPIPASARRKTMPDKIKAGDPYPYRGDLDNLCKAVLDALNGLAFTDDALVVEISARKEYGEPGAEVTITEVAT